MNNIKVIHVEDDLSQRELVKKWLSIEGYEVSSYEDAASFFKARLDDISCIVLDWELPDKSGLDILKGIRKHNDDISILFATLRDSEEDVVSALQAGADDYIVKPLRQQEFSARIKAVLRRTGALDLSELPEDVSPYKIDIKHERIWLNDEEIILTNKEYLLALMLFKHHDEIVSRQQIMKEVWGKSSDLNTRTIDTHISRIRNKLKLGDETGWHLYSIYLHGYRLRKNKD